MFSLSCPYFPAANSRCCLRPLVPPTPVQKFSSNVVEKCLQMASEDLRDVLVRELCCGKGIEAMLLDQYGACAVSSSSQLSFW